MSDRVLRTARRTGNVALLMMLGTLLIAGGCERGPQRAPVSGKVLLDDQPLKFGSVMFQPPSGQPARADIQSDGSFSMDTPGAGPGAVVGTNQVRVTCFSNQDPAAVIDRTKEAVAGHSFIPTDYNHFSTSGLTVDIPATGKTDIVLKLKSK